ncbi:MAG: VWA domain-containing protein [Deltaproteobacteria bacterium]|nr:VWA domain-containing protein [Deltaproteobacteria bacterium]
MRKSLSVVFVGLSGLALLACGGNGSGDPFSGTGGSGGVVLTCASLQNPPPDCDETCTSDSQCEASFCQNGKCVANCTATEGCGPNATCNTARGRCVPNMGTGGTGGIGNTGGNACQSVTITPTRTIPNVMFLVDQSGSMTSNFSGKERWTAAHDAIVTVTEQLDAIVRFGLTTYTSDNGNFNAACPRLPVAGDPFAGAPRVDFGLNNSGAISNTSVYPSSYPNDAGADTPTGDSIDALMTIIENDPPPADGPTIIVLATDGLPDSCECPNPGSCVPGTPGSHDPELEAVDAAENAFSSGVQTFILSVGPDVAQSHLQEVANVGVGLDRDGSEGNAPFYTANTPAELDMAFQDIIGDSISCDIQMDKRFDDKEKACNDPESDVQLNGVPLSCPTEWRVKPGVDDIIELLGSACDTFKSGDVTFSAEFPCGAIVVE